MSTKLEDLSDDEYVEDRYADEEEDQYFEEECDQEIEVAKPRRKTKENFEENEQESLNTRIYNMLVEKLKNPALVSLIFLLLTHPLLIQGIFRLPYVEVADSTIGVNVILSILAGILFFVLQEFL